MNEPYYWPDVGPYPAPVPTVRKNARREPAPSGHTSAWDRQSLGLMEAAVLARAWAPAAPDSVTRNSEEA